MFLVRDGLRPGGRIPSRQGVRSLIRSAALRGAATPLDPCFSGTLNVKRSGRVPAPKALGAWRYSAAGAGASPSSSISTRSDTLRAPIIAVKGLIPQLVWLIEKFHRTLPP